MKRLLVAAALVLLATPAFAQPPREVVPEGNISLGVGQVKVFMFSEPLSRVNVITKGTVEATPQSDRQISIVGLAEGATQMFVYSPAGERLYGATVTVTAESGHLVKIYGTGKNDDINAGFVQMYCNEFTCGRPDKDLPVPTVSVERISRGPRDAR
jgi:hypothetical protein